MIKALLQILISYILTSGVLGHGIFTKQRDYKLSLSDGVSFIQEVKSTLDCEKLCMDRFNKCVAANVIFLKHSSYECTLFENLPADSRDTEILRNPRGELIRRKEIERLTISSCDSSSANMNIQFCKYAIDRIVDPNTFQAWVADLSDTDVWLRLNLDSDYRITQVKIWWLCSGEAQFSKLYFTFSNGHVQTVRHQCSSETEWSACSGDEAMEVFNIHPVSTNFIRISGVDCQSTGDPNGFLEVEVWGLKE